MQHFSLFGLSLELFIPFVLFLGYFWKSFAMLSAFILMHVEKWQYFYCERSVITTLFSSIDFCKIIKMLAVCQDFW